MLSHFTTITIRVPLQAHQNSRRSSQYYDHAHVFPDTIFFFYPPPSHNFMLFHFLTIKPCTITHYIQAFVPTLIMTYPPISTYHVFRLTIYTNCLLAFLNSTPIHLLHHNGSPLTHFHYHSQSTSSHTPSYDYLLTDYKSLPNLVPSHLPDIQMLRLLSSFHTQSLAQSH